MMKDQQLSNFIPMKASLLTSLCSLPDPTVDVRMEINQVVQDVVNEAQHQHAT